LHKGVSVIICCHNSEKVLPETLRHLLKQKLTYPIDWEVIIIDNGSNDWTKAVAEDEWSKQNTTTSLRIISEPRLGLSNARRRGVEESIYDYIIFCDDDNWLCENYVQDVFTILDTNKSVGACGGNGEPVCEGQKPQWLEKHAGAYAFGDQGKETGKVEKGVFGLFGAGLSLRKNIITKLYALGFESLLSDRKGNSLSSGGDSELTYLISILGYELWSSPLLRYKHFLQTNRLNRAHLMKLNYGIGSSAPMLLVYRIIQLNQVNSINSNWSFQLIKSFVHLIYNFVFPPIKGERKVFFNRYKGNVKAMWDMKNKWKSSIDYILAIRVEYLKNEK